MLCLRGGHSKAGFTSQIGGRRVGGLPLIAGGVSMELEDGAAAIEIASRLISRHNRCSL
jgi:hypothetical protein